MLADIRYAIRVLSKSPLFAFTAIAALALGIGANTAIYSIINALLVNPLGIDDPERTVAIRVRYDRINLPDIGTSAPDFASVRDSRDVFSAAAAMQLSDYAFTGAAMPERLVGAQVSWQWFEVFGFHPVHGRAFRREDDVPGSNRVVVLTYATWQRLFGGDPEAVGQTILLNEESHKVIGVMGREFRWPNGADIWIPLALPPERFLPGDRHNQNLFTVARVRPDVPVERIGPYLDVMTRRIIEEEDETREHANAAGWSIFAKPFVEQTAGDLRSPLLIVMGAAGLVLLIACSNIAGLMLARITSGGRELAVRAALGAGTWRLVRQTTAESVVLSAIGAAAGVALAFGGVRALAASAPENLPYRLDIPVDGSVLLFALGVVVAATLIFGAAPAWQVVRTNRYELLKEGGRGGTSGRGRQRLRSALVVGQVALALMLLAGAGLLLKSLAHLQEVNPGFEPKNVMTAMVTLPNNRYDTKEKSSAFHRAIVEQLKNLSGVKSAAAIAPLPFTGSEWSASFQIEGREVRPGDPTPHGRIGYVSEDYFRTMGIRLLKGRYFTEQDRLETERVAVIDENLLRQHWPDRDPLGERIGQDDRWATIVGIVTSVHHSELESDSQKGVYYYPIYQQPTPVCWYVIKTESNPAGLAGAVRQAVLAVDSSRPASDLRSMEERLGASLGAKRFAVTLLAVFAGLALLMAVLGLYGIINYTVSRQTQEIGVRMALGARTSEILRLVLGKGMRLAIAGVALGLMATLMLSGYLESQLFEMSAIDPPTFAGVVVVLVAVTLLACYVPARRATKVHPSTALRYE